MLKWYVIQVYSNCEKKVKMHIEERIQLDNLGQFFGEVLIPTEEVIEIRAGQKRKSERKYFPGYMLIEMEMTDSTWKLIRSVPKVNNFVGGTNYKPTPISQEEVQRILGSIKIDEHSQPKPKTSFQNGQIVRVLDGPFTDFTGSVEKVNYEKSRLQVAVSIFGRATPVELEFSQVEKDS